MSEEITLLPATISDSETKLYLMLEVAKYNEVQWRMHLQRTGTAQDLCSTFTILSNAFNRFYHGTKILAEEDAKKKESSHRTV